MHVVSKVFNESSLEATDLPASAVELQDNITTVDRQRYINISTLTLRLQLSLLRLLQRSLKIVLTIRSPVMVHFVYNVTLTFDILTFNYNTRNRTKQNSANFL